MVDGGIYRDVFLYSTAPAHIADVFAVATPDADFKNGELTIRVKTGFSGDPWATGRLRPICATTPDGLF